MQPAENPCGQSESAGAGSSVLLWEGASKNDEFLLRGRALRLFVEALRRLLRLLVLAFLFFQALVETLWSAIAHGHLFLSVSAYSGPYSKVADAAKWTKFTG